MTHHHHHHGWKHPRMSAEMRRRLAPEGPDDGTQPVNDHEHQHHHNDVHLKEHHNDRREVEVVQTVTTVVATAIDLILESGSETIAEYTVPTLPAVISNSRLGLLTIPADADAPLTAAEKSSGAHPAETEATLTGPTAIAATVDHQIPLKSSSISAFESKAVPTATSETLTSSSSPETAPTIPASETSAINTATSDTVVVSGSEASTSASTSSSTSISTSSPTSIPTTIPVPTTATLSSTTPVSSSTIVSSSSAISSSDEGTITSPTSSASSAASSHSAGGIDTSKVVGGVVGGVLGIVLILLLAFLLLRWKRRRASDSGSMISRGGDFGGDTQRLEPRSAEMASQRSSNTPLAAGAIMGRWGQPLSPSSHTDEKAAGKRGFQKISGRKIPSVLRTGGDGYGDEIEEEPAPEMRTPPLESTSPVSPHAPLGRSEYSGMAMMRSSPARTPTMSTVDLPASGQATQVGAALLRPDALGRTLSKYDGSRGSRFTESI